MAELERDMDVFTACFGRATLKLSAPKFMPSYRR